MTFEIKDKQYVSKHCFVCGVDNPLGLKMKFYVAKTGELIGILKKNRNLQGYPGRLHGGIGATILDEAIGRAITIEMENVWGITIDLNVKYRKPVPLDRDIFLVCRVEKNKGRTYFGRGEIVLSNGDVAIEASGTYLKVPVEKLGDSGSLMEELVVEENDKSEITI